MSILSPPVSKSNKPVKSKAAAWPHDRDLCGLGGSSECEECKAVRARAERHLCEHDAEAKERERLQAIAARFKAATGISLDELLLILAESIAEIVGAVMDERGAA